MKKPIDKNSVWEKMKEYLIAVFKSDLVDNTILRSDLMAYFSSSINPTSTVDNYRNYLTKAGFLERTKRGVFEIVKQIPENLTSEELFKLAYPEK